MCWHELAQLDEIEAERLDLARTPYSAERSGSRPVSTVCSPCRCDTMAGNADSAVGPRWPLIRIKYKGERLFHGAIVGDRRVNANHRDPVMTSHPASSQSGSVVGGREIRHPDQMAPCRCGHSGNEPFCDGTHLTVDFDGTLAS